MNQFSCSVISDSLQPHGLQHAKPPWPSPTPGVYSNSCPLSPSNHLILCCPLLLRPPIALSIRVFPNESTLLMRWPKYWSFSFSIIPSIEIPGRISFKMDWLDLLEVQGTLKSLLQHHSSKASILRHLTFFIVQLSHPYMTTGKTIALTAQTLKLVMLSYHLILCRPLLLLLSVFPSNTVFSSELALRIRWPKYWSFTVRISPSSEYSGLISFRIDWFDLLAVQRTLKSLLQHHSSKASILTLFHD